MFKYLTAAFWARVDVPALGRVPVNFLAVLCAGILGFGEPAIWLLGLGVEIAYLFALATNPRFQKVIDAENLPPRPAEVDPEQKRQELIGRLSPASRARFARLEEKANRAIDLSRTLQADQYVVDSNAEAMRKLLWFYLKLLIAQHYLQSDESQSLQQTLRTQFEQMRKSVDDPKISETARESRRATLQLLEKRVDNFERREQSLSEIDSDLTRIEAQVDLAVDNASLFGKPQAISGNLDLVSHLLETGSYGSIDTDIADLDATFATPTVAQRQ